MSCLFTFPFGILFFHTFCCCYLKRHHLPTGNNKVKAGCLTTKKTTTITILEATTKLKYKFNLWLKMWQVFAFDSVIMYECIIFRPTVRLSDCIFFFLLYYKTTSVNKCVSEGFAYFNAKPFSHFHSIKCCQFWQAVVRRKRRKNTNNNNNNNLSTTELKNDKSFTV